MKVYILLDKNNIVRCMASEECNLHKDKLQMKKYLVELGGIVGDEYSPKTGKWKARPENYPKPSEEELAEAKIQQEMRKIAIDNLKAQGELPQDYQ